MGILRKDKARKTAGKSAGEESVLPLLTQESNSKSRRGILRRAVFSEDQRKALEKMFQKQKYISKTDRKKLALNLGLKESQSCTDPKSKIGTDGSVLGLVLFSIFLNDTERGMECILSKFADTKLSNAADTRGGDVIQENLDKLKGPQDLTKTV
ncbi:hypothetical protein HGM15179_000455 [Zosterops borbonicus]|uniref:Homeobox domain-containing protein n=1 Tax=Zosterops borbonicus TaxID=364589 RepID=A0A8K1GWD9_9PASS|nr:hypothetical protein HGM15179_000455 [Zosterops borbonicus]